MDTVNTEIQKGITALSVLKFIGNAIGGVCLIGIVLAAVALVLYVIVSFLAIHVVPRIAPTLSMPFNQALMIKICFIGAVVCFIGGIMDGIADLIK